MHEVIICFEKMVDIAMFACRHARLFCAATDQQQLYAVRAEQSEELPARAESVPVAGIGESLS